MKAEDRYDSLIVWYALKYGRDPRQVKRQLRTESWFNPKAKNKNTGAMGLAQFMPDTWKEWRDCTPGIQASQAELLPLDPYNPEDAIAAHCSYMRWLEHQAGSLEGALAAYVWGIGNLQVCKGRYADEWLTHIPKDARDYVRKCMGYVAEVI